MESAVWNSHLLMLHLMVMLHLCYTCAWGRPHTSVNVVHRIITIIIITVLLWSLISRLVTYFYYKPMT